jgi:hypothetical protein
MGNSERQWDKQALSCVGATLRDATKFVTEEPLPTVLWMLLLELEQAEVARAKESHNLAHWTSDREPKKKS